MTKKIEKASADVLQLLKEAEQAKLAAHFNEVFLKNITRVLPQYVFWKNIHSVYLGCNSNYANLVGLSSAEDIIGKTDNDLNWQSMGHTTETFQKGDQDTIAGHHITNQEEILALPNGTKIITLVSKLPIIDNGKVIGIVGYFTDITELKNKEEELINAKKQAEIANESKSTFITNISHDIRTPLSGMIGMTRILFKDLQTEQGKEAARSLLMAGNVLLELMNEVIEFTKLASNEAPINKVKFSLKDVIESIIMLEKPFAEQKKLKLSVDLDEKIPSYIIGDQLRTHRILLNLISNAMKFTEHGSVKVSAHLSKEKGRDVVLKISIKDTGIGVSAKNQQVIFSRFTRLEESYKGKYKGFGLGLSIVKQFITEIDGEIYIDSEEGIGSTFTCIIPYKKAFLEDGNNISSLTFNHIVPDDIDKIQIGNSAITDNTEVYKNSPISTETVKTAKILLVEDTPIAQLAAKSLLEEMNCEVILADTGEKAISLFKKDKYDLVFMDIGLPGKDGCETTQEIRAWEKLNNQHTPIIALTAHIDESNKQKCLNVGMEKVLTKPLYENTLGSILETFVREEEQCQQIEKENSRGVNDLQVIDLTFGAKIISGSKEDAKEILDLLVKGLPEMQSEMQIAYEAQNHDNLQFIVHKLLGGCSYCGVPRLKEAAKKLEDILKAKNLDEIKHYYLSLCSEISHLLDEYKIVK